MCGRSERERGRFLIAILLTSTRVCGLLLNRIFRRFIRATAVRNFVSIGFYFLFFMDSLISCITWYNERNSRIATRNTQRSVTHVTRRRHRKALGRTAYTMKLPSQHVIHETPSKKSYTAPLTEKSCHPGKKSTSPTREHKKKGGSSGVYV